MRELIVTIIVLVFVLMSTSGKSQDLDVSESEFRTARVVQLLGLRTIGQSNGGWQVLVEFEEDGLEPRKMVLTVSKARYDRLVMGDKIKVYHGPKPDSRD